MAQSLVPQALCNVSDVKRVIVQNPSATLSDAVDGFLIDLINLFSTSVEKSQWLNRELVKKERTEYFDGGGAYIQVAAPPFGLDSNNDDRPQVRVWDGGESRSFVDLGGTGETELDLYTDFAPNINTGLITYRGSLFACGVRSVKVVYTGGLVTPTPDAGTGPLDVPHDLRVACAMQCASWWQRRRELSLESVSIPGGGHISIMDPTKLLTYVRQVLLSYKRFRFVGQ